MKRPRVGLTLWCPPVFDMAKPGIYALRVDLSRRKLRSFRRRGSAWKWHFSALSGDKSASSSYFALRFLAEIGLSVHPAPIPAAHAIFYDFDRAATPGIVREDETTRLGRVAVAVFLEEGAEVDPADPGRGPETFGLGQVLAMDGHALVWAPKAGRLAGEVGAGIRQARQRLLRRRRQRGTGHCQERCK